MHDGESKLEERQVATELACRGSLQQRERVGQNKAEQKQHNQNAVITMVWSVIQVNILTLRPTFVTTKAKTTGLQQLHTTHDGNVLTIAGLLRPLKLPWARFEGVCLMLSITKMCSPVSSKRHTLRGRAPAVYQTVYHNPLKVGCTSTFQTCVGL